MKHLDFVNHLAVAAIVTILCGLVYVSVQQAHRSAANDPQLQVAGDIDNKLRAGGSIDQWIKPDTVDIASSLSVFQTLYDDKERPVFSSGFLNGKMPLLPPGVFDFTRKTGENIFTWQPERRVRIAVVLKATQSPAYSFIAVGRSLLETEKRQQNLLRMVFIGWLLCTGVIVFHWIIKFLKTKNIEVHYENETI